MADQSVLIQEIENNLSKADIDRADDISLQITSGKGITEEVVRLISKHKKEPQWMLELRLKALQYFKEKSMPTWGPDISSLNINEIIPFLIPGAKESKDWADVPKNIRDTFDRLGIPEAEKKYLSGVGAQMESEMVYHNLKEEWAKKGVVFENMDVALQKYPDLVKKYFMTKCIPINDHKFISLHAAVWSGGTFIYVPEGVSITIPLQAYFRMNAKGAGQFEHTLIIAEKNSEVHYIEGCSAPQHGVHSLHAGCVEVYVGENARVRYSSVENWSKNTFNLNTKRAIVEKNGTMEWIGGNLGSGVTMLYPCSVLKGEGARAEHIGVAFAGKDQNQDTGAKVYHLAKNTTSIIKSKSICKDGGITTYRGLVKVIPGAKNSKVHVSCDAMMLDVESKNNTVPTMTIQEDDVHIAHEATVGKLSTEQIFYLMSRGLTEQEATAMIVNGFIEPITKNLPLEYAVELNRLIELELEGSVG